MPNRSPCIAPWNATCFARVLRNLVDAKRKLKTMRLGSGPPKNSYVQSIEAKSNLNRNGFRIHETALFFWRFLLPLISNTLSWVWIHNCKTTMAGVTITSSPAVFWLACAQLRQIALRCYGRSLLSSRLATGRHLVVICDICHRMISCFIVCCLCCLSFLNASFFLNGFLDAAQLLFSGASYVIRIKWWQMHPEKMGLSGSSITWGQCKVI